MFSRAVYVFVCVCVRVCVFVCVCVCVLTWVYFLWNLTHGNELVHFDLEKNMLDSYRWMQV